MNFKKKDFFTIPNILTYIRILLVPVFIIVYTNSETLYGHIWSAIIVIVSAATDVVDGMIARKCNLITDLGKILDPIADKAMQFSLIFCVVARYPLVWLLFVVYAVKELVSLAFSGYLFRHGKYIEGANWAGKLCTVVLFIVMLALVAVPKVSHGAVRIMVAVAAAVMILAFAVYMNSYIKLLKELRAEQKQEKIEKQEEDSEQ